MVSSQFSSLLLIASTALSFAAPSEKKGTTSAVNTTTCNGQTYVYNNLAGYGALPSDSRDKFGDTLGGLGSAIALNQKSWKRNGKSYNGEIWTLPDRGWNTEGTLNFQPRVHKFLATFTPNDSATVASPSPANLKLQYLDTVRLSGPDFNPTTGLDPDVTGHISFPLFPDLPGATYTGDGFGGNGTGGRRISIDSEGLVINDDGTFWVSDEYGPYIYKFSPLGNMIQAIRPPNAYIPQRNGTESFSAASPPRYDPNRQTIPANPTSGRANNQGFEGLTVSPDGKTLYVLLQSAAIQEGGLDNGSRRYTRFLVYDVPLIGTPTVKAEYVVPLPIYLNANGKKRVAAQSEIYYISDTQFLVLARDSNSGHGQSDSLSRYRHVDVFDISNATNVNTATYNAINGSIASSNGTLKTGITAATYCSWLDYNVNAQLNRFGVHNGGAQDAGLLNEKWESLALAPINGNGGDGKFYLFSFSDNDFITQNGYLKDGQFKYADESGFNLDNQMLVFEVTLPKGTRAI